MVTTNNEQFTVIAAASSTSTSIEIADEGSSAMVLNVEHNGEEERPSKKNKGKGKNFREDENLQLCKSYTAIGIDPDTGAEQKVVNFWKKVKAHFTAALKTEDKFVIDRPEDSLRIKWSNLLQPSVLKFAGCLRKTLKKNTSGSNEAYDVSISIRST